MVIARIELYIKKGIDDALKRAKSYVGAGADAIMIQQSKTQMKSFLF